MRQLECRYGHEKYIKQQFLDLPRKIFGRNLKLGDFAVTIPDFQDKKLEKAILDGKHVLSSDFECVPFIVLDDNRCVARALVTLYEGDEAAYVGFFESFDDSEAVCKLMEDIASFAREKKRVKLVGPLDASFWIQYRFKLNHFDKTYTSEPVNPEYYPVLWEKAGFVMTDHYYSNMIRVPGDEDQNEKCVKRLDLYKQRGYEFRHPSRENFEQSMSDVYDSLIQLYKKFPGFKSITREQFLVMYASLKNVLDFDYVELAYKDDKLKGFSISVPNYNGLTVGKITISKLLKIFKIKRKPSEYVALYMGAERDSLGLGGAFAEIIRRKLQRDQATAISALIHDGKVTGYYHDELYTGKIEYGLYQKII